MTAGPSTAPREWTLMGRIRTDGICWWADLAGPVPEDGEIVKLIERASLDRVVEEFKNEAESNRVLAKRFDGDLELRTQYDSAARAWDSAARRLEAALQSGEGGTA